VARSFEELASARDEWDELAVLANRPYSAPAWGMAWWKYRRPVGATLKVILVCAEEGLVGVVPTFAVGRSYSLVGDELAPVEPLSRPGREEEVARLAAGVLAESRPGPNTIALRLQTSSADWAKMLDAGWPGKHGLWHWVSAEAPLPGVDLGEGGFETWMGQRSSTFRREMRRKNRKLGDAGGVFRYTTEETLEDDVRTFLDLHRRRLTGRGGTNLAGEGVEQMLVAVGSSLLPSGRFRLLCLELGGRSIAMQLLLAAGKEVSAWNTGFDEAYAKLSPVMLCMVHSVADAANRGERTMSFGSGGQAYKRRLANNEECLRSQLLLPFGKTYPLLRLRLAPRQARRWLGKRFRPGPERRLRWPAAR
jgi:Acetyltransferase (GNAT) domain